MQSNGSDPLPHCTRVIRSYTRLPLNVDLSMWHDIGWAWQWPILKPKLSSTHLPKRDLNNNMSRLGSAMSNDMADSAQWRAFGERIAQSA